MKKGNRSKFIIKLVGLALLTFTVVLLVCEIAVAIVNNMFADSKLGAYTITLMVIPAISLVLTVLLVLSYYSTSKKSELLVESLNRVANGDYSVSIEVKSADTFAEVYENFNKMTRELNSVKTLREDFIRELSHEIKTPLSSINGFANLLLDGDLSEEENKKILKIIADEALRLKKFADGILLMSKLENQQFTGERQSFRLDLQITDCIILLEQEWESKNIEIISELDNTKIVGDNTLIAQIWLNLLGNAIKFAPAGGKVEVKLRRENGFAVAEIKDNGAGISPEDLPHIFDKYYRAEEAKIEDGNGLGLAICKRICDLSGGKISVDSKKGEGCTFKVALPLS